MLNAIDAFREVASGIPHSQHAGSLVSQKEEDQRASGRYV
jgi:hypothetical protein